MSEKNINVRILRFTPSVDKEPRYQIYEVPIVSGMSVLNILDYIYQNLDGTLAYYSHTACHRGVCGRCTLLINGKASLACQTTISEDTTIEPVPNFRVIRDLVYQSTAKRTFPLC